MIHPLGVAQAEEFYRGLDKVEYDLCEGNFLSFLKATWPILEPETELKINWHHGYLAEYLTACYMGQIRRLIINIQPKGTKSIEASVAFPCWVWANKRETDRFICASYADSLSTKHSMDRRNVIKSPWYQRGWGDRVKLASDQDVKTEFMNTRRGHMTATSMGGAATGKGCNWLIIDDPHDAERAESKIERERVIRNFDLKLATRIDDLKTGVIIVIMQRLHENDLTGHLIEKGGYTHIRIPTEEDEPRKVYVYPISKREKVRKLGDILHPDRFGAEEIAKQKVALGEYGYAGQYQQVPSPRVGGMLKRDNWTFYNELPSKFDDIIGSWDCSFKEKAESDFVVGGVLGRVGVRIYLLWLFRQRTGIVGTMKAMEQSILAWPRQSRILVEDAANGSAVIELMKKKISRISPITASRSKTERVALIVPGHEAKNYMLPNPSTHPWVGPFIEECAIFPKGRNDDQVDMLSQGGGYFVEHETDYLKALTTM